MSKGQWRTRPHEIALAVKHVRKAVEENGLQVKGVEVDMSADRTRVIVHTGRSGVGNGEPPASDLDKWLKDKGNDARQA